MAILSNDIHEAIDLLSQDEVVAIPTETVYGLAGNIYSEQAIRKVFELKQRPFYNPLIVHISSMDALDGVVRDLPEKAGLLAKAFWPGPLTLILKKQADIPDLVTAGKDTVGVRVPNHPLSLQLLEALPFPLAAPSANPFTHISPTTPQHVESYFGNRLSMILDGGACARGIESTIIGFEEGEAVLYRLGSISVEDIEGVVGAIPIKNKKEQAPDAPGMLSRHYAPRTPTYLVDEVTSFLATHSGQKIGVLVLNQVIEASNETHLIRLSETGDLAEAASNLYTALHTLDQLDLDLIVAERMPDKGLGKSINDRLERATKRE